MKIIKTKKFNKWAVKSKVEDPALLKAAEEVIEGIYLFMVLKRVTKTI